MFMLLQSMYFVVNTPKPNDANHWEKRRNSYGGDSPFLAVLVRRKSDYGQRTLLDVSYIISVTLISKEIQTSSKTRMRAVRAI